MEKLAEKVLLIRFQEQVEKLNLFPYEQFAFRPCHTTSHQVFRPIEQVTCNFNQNESTGTIFIDALKAFDKYWHERLLYQLLEAEIHPGLMALIASFLREMRFRVRLCEARSSKPRLEDGVPQGSLLSLFMCSLFTGDMPRTDGTSLALSKVTPPSVQDLGHHFWYFDNSKEPPRTW